MDEIAFHRALFRSGTLVDAGAHAGAMTLALADLPWRRIIAFEPLAGAFPRLRVAVRARWGCVPPHLVLRPEALGAAAGEAVLEVPVVGGAAQEQWASVVKDYAALQSADPRIEAVRRQTVRVLPLDALELDEVSAIKVDVEGGEEEMLRGAAATLSRCRPVLSVEIEERHRPGSTRRVPALLAQLGYEGWWEFYGEWRPIERFDAALMQRASPSPASFEVGEPYVFCFYSVPPDRRAELAALARLP